MIDDIRAKVRLHQKRLELAEIKSWEKIDSTVFNYFEKIKTIDTFIYRLLYQTSGSCR